MNMTVFKLVKKSVALLIVISMIPLTMRYASASSLADLTPTAIQYNSGSIATGKKILLDSGIQNIGGSDTGVFNIKWFVNDVQVGYGGHGSVAAGVTDLNGNSAYEWMPSAIGTYVIRFAVDTDQNVEESNDGNNETTVTIQVPSSSKGNKTTDAPRNNTTIQPTNKPTVTTPQPIVTQKVMVLCFDPAFLQANGVKQHDLVSGWNDPHTLAKQFQSDIRNASHGNATYEIVEWNDLNELPRSTSGFSYSINDYYNTLQKALKKSAYWDYEGWRQPNGYDFDYDYYLTMFDAYQKVEQGNIDEVWIFTGPCTGVGAYESIMIGRDAYFCNSSPMIRQDCSAFVCYVFNYERDVGCMLEDAGHRMESIMSHIYGRWDYNQPINRMNDWELFTLYDKVSPGNAACGNVHFAPNSKSDYDWGNSTKVSSTCNDWANYPNLSGKKSTVSCSSWGNGDMRRHHIWWFDLIPHADGIKNGVYNNWWRYFLYPTSEN